MTSRWIDTLEDIYADGGDWEDMVKILDSMNKLLFRAALGTEDATLHDDIMKELENV